MITAPPARTSRHGHQYDALIHEASGRARYRSIACLLYIPQPCSRARAIRPWNAMSATWRAPDNPRPPPGGSAANVDANSDRLSPELVSAFGPPGTSICAGDFICQRSMKAGHWRERNRIRLARPHRAARVACAAAPAAPPHRQRPTARQRSARPDRWRCSRGRQRP